MESGRETPRHAIDLPCLHPGVGRAPISLSTPIPVDPCPRPQPNYRAIFAGDNYEASWTILVWLFGNNTYKPINPLVSREVGDFTPFYITIAICSVILGSILILNFICCCSRYSEYWLDRHTGNRWIVSIWSSTPHKQPPLDFTELESQYGNIQLVHPPHTEYLASRHREDDVPPSLSQQPLTSSQEYLELHKCESDI
ncbi:hypothetical protein JYU34_000269 [Plutella xylostella]|uniref:Uncharacterized protein n=1 Tax=Plutella xylostella TaxID=51655 RepID=A0ABQ7R7A9_PLUXY|nr:hypothetical protein JYU34_000269 [Plutella xylostella]